MRLTTDNCIYHVSSNFAKCRFDLVSVGDALKLITGALVQEFVDSSGRVSPYDFVNSTVIDDIFRKALIQTSTDCTVLCDYGESRYPITSPTANPNDFRFEVMHQSRQLNHWFYCCLVIQNNEDTRIPELDKLH
jgi:hypothetical protein